jgi:hypothetical protein
VEQSDPPTVSASCASVMDLIDCTGVPCRRLRG